MRLSLGSVVLEVGRTSRPPSRCCPGKDPMWCRRWRPPQSRRRRGAPAQRFSISEQEPPSGAREHRDEYPPQWHGLGHYHSMTPVVRDRAVTPRFGGATGPAVNGSVVGVVGMARFAAVRVVVGDLVDVAQAGCAPLDEHDVQETHPVGRS